jgi:hypothetical protein
MALLAISCNKKEKNPPPPPEPEKPGTLEVRVITYDSLGDLNADHSGVKVTLQNGASATTGTDGVVQFPNLPPDNYAPVLTKADYEGPFMSVRLLDDFESTTIPFPHRSPFAVSVLSGDAYSESSVQLDVTLDKPVPAGKSCKLVILGDSVPGVSPSKYLSADMTSIDGQYFDNLNVALPSLRTFMAKLRKSQFFYVMAVPVSYGLYNSNLLTNPIVLGRSYKTSKYVRLTRNW